jgi:hypothetical protein
MSRQLSHGVLVSAVRAVSRQGQVKNDSTTNGDVKREAMSASPERKSVRLRDVMAPTTRVRLLPCLRRRQARVLAEGSNHKKGSHPLTYALPSVKCDASSASYVVGTVRCGRCR